MDTIYDLEDYSLELDAEARELEQDDYDEWMDSLEDPLSSDGFLDRRRQGL